MGPRSFHGQHRHDDHDGSSSSFDLYADAKGTIFGQGIELKGDINSDGYYDLTGSAKVALGPITLANAGFDSGSAKGFNFTDSWSYLLFSGNVTVTMNTANDNVSVYAMELAPGANLTLTGYIDGNGQFHLNGLASV